MKTMFSLVLTAALSMSLALMSCSKNNELTSAGEELSGDEKLTLEEEFGGYETTDETVAFGEASLLDEFPEDAVANDNYAGDPVVVDGLSDGMPADSARKAYYLRITFGLLEGDSSATEVVDWSGSAEVNKGTLVVLKTIRFEGNDHLVLPRDSRQKVEFVAQTKPHFDGLLLAIIDNDTTDAEGSFTFMAGGYQKTLAFSELDSLELLEPVGAGGHEVSIVTRSKEVVPFAGGFLSGRWIKAGQNNGHFRGRWINSTGTNAGHLRGIWGVNRGGENVFRGKFISMNGEFKGLLSGHWRYDRGENSGSFDGRWVNRSLDTVGKVHGKFKTGRAGSGRGFFHGRYRWLDSN